MDDSNFDNSSSSKQHRCEECGAGFSTRRAMTRHLSQVHDGQRHECPNCHKTYKRKDRLTAHLRTCKSQWTCPECGQEFQSLLHFNRHKTVQHPVAPRDLTVRKRRRSEEANSGKRKRQAASAVELASDPPQPDPALFPDDDVEIRTLYAEHWASLRTHHLTGQRTQDRFNYRLTTTDTTEWEDQLRSDILEPMQLRFKINLSYGFVLRHHTTGQLRYYHSSQNNARVLDQPRLVTNAADFEEFLRDIRQPDILEWARQKRPDSKWIVERITNVTFYVNKIQNHPIGCGSELPEYVVNNTAIIALQRDEHNNYLYKDNLCLFRCLAIWSGCHPHNFSREVLHYFQTCEGKDADPKTFPGILLEELPMIEDKLQLNINVYQLVEVDDENGQGRQVVAKVVQRSHRSHTDVMNVNLHEQHFSYITDINTYCKSFSCRKCGKLWKHLGMLHRHERTCDETVKHQYVGGAYHLPKTVFEQLEDEGIVVPEADRYYPYRATYDFECYMQQDDLPQNSNKVTWEAQHVPLSVSLCSNVPGYTEPICYVTEGDTEELVRKMMERLEVIAETAYLYLLDKFEHVFSQLQDKLEEAQQLEDEEEDRRDDEDKAQHPLQKLQTRLAAYLVELPVVGFNSGKYDLNVIKPALMKYLQEHEPVNFVVKKNNAFMCLKTQKLKFVDIINYLAPGFNYDKFLKAFGCSVAKGFLPYEWIDSLDKLDHPTLPAHETFFSTLKNENISQEDYTYCQQVWEEGEMNTFRDFLVWYNNRDVVPFLEALDKQAAFYVKRHIDLMKDGISVPGLTMKYLFQDLPHNTYFTLYDAKNKDLHHLVKDNIVGGPSIIFHRYHEKDKTKLRETEYADEAELCQNVTGFDANALYLWCLMQDMPTGWYVRRRAENSFKPETSHRQSRAAVEWLEWTMASARIDITHAFNGKEKRLGRRQIPVDGWCQKTQTVYQFHGCYWHGHSCSLNRKDFNDTRQLPMTQLREETEKNTAYLRQLGYKVVELWECQWQGMKKTDRDLQRFITTHFRRRLDKKQAMTEEEVLQVIESGELFGLVECDIHVPSQLESHFAEMQPIFKNTTISRDDIGETMRDFAETNNIMPQPRRSLVGSFKGEKLLLATPLLQWYLEHGLVVSRIYQVVQYWPDNCFERFGQEVSNARREGDKDPSKAIIADTMKLLGNSGYGKTVTNKERHRDVKYCNEDKVSALVNDPLFRVLNPLTEDTYEVELSKKKIKLDLPLHIGFFVYQYAKLKMLAFYYDFLDVFVSRRHFQLCEMDTDSLYMALSSPSLEAAVKPEKRHEFYEIWPQWLPAEACDRHHPEFVASKSRGETWTPTEDCCIERKRHDKRTPGLFKVEWEGDGIIGLCSKTYYCFGAKDKHSCKGISKKQNQLDKERYMNVLTTKTSGHGTNRGFRVRNNKMYTYTQDRAGLTFFYPKRIVAPDGISTSPTLL